MPSSASASQQGRSGSTRPPSRSSATRATALRRAEVLLAREQAKAASDRASQLATQASRATLVAKRAEKKAERTLSKGRSSRRPPAGRRQPAERPKSAGPRRGTGAGGSVAQAAAMAGQQPAQATPALGNGSSSGAGARPSSASQSRRGSRRPKTPLDLTAVTQHEAWGQGTVASQRTSRSTARSTASWARDAAQAALSYRSNVDGGLSARLAAEQDGPALADAWKDDNVSVSSSVPSIGSVRKIKGQPTSEAMPEGLQLGRHYGRMMMSESQASLAAAAADTSGAVRGKAAFKYTVHIDPLAKFYGKTTAMESFTEPPKVKAVAAKPREKWTPSGVKFNYRTTSQTDFLNIPASPPKKFKPRQNLTTQNLRFDGRTMAMESFTYSKKGLEEAWKSRRHSNNGRGASGGPLAATYKFDGMTESRAASKAVEDLHLSGKLDNSDFRSKAADSGRHRPEPIPLVLEGRDFKSMSAVLHSGGISKVSGMGRKMQQLRHAQLRSQRKEEATSTNKLMQ